MSTENNTIRNVYIAVGVFCLVATLVYLVNSLVNVATRASNDEGRAEHVAAATDERIKPVTIVNAGDVSVAPVARTGQQIVETTCASCHATGALNAPKIDSKGDWKPRLAAGMNTLMKNAINGKGAMPARGGDGSLTDDDIKNAIQYMLKKAGL